MSKNDEMLDIVDSNNKVIGQELRSKTFKKGLLHRAANIFIFNSEGKVFLQRRSSKVHKYPLFWDMSAGEHVKVGESIKDAATRGVKEELGISISLKKVIPLHHIKSGMADKKDQLVDNELVETYQGLFDGQIKLDLNEVAEGKFFSIKEVNKMIKNPDNKFTSWFLEDWELLQKADIV